MDTKNVINIGIIKEKGLSINKNLVDKIIIGQCHTYIGVVSFEKIFTKEELILGIYDKFEKQHTINEIKQKSNIILFAILNNGEIIKGKANEKISNIVTISLKKEALICL